MILRRSRFGDVVSRQLDLFAQDEAGALAECREREAAYDRAPRGEAEEAYGDYRDAVDAAVDVLERMRDAFAATLDEAVAADYEAELARAVRRRWPPLGAELETR